MTLPFSSPVARCLSVAHPSLQDDSLSDDVLEKATQIALVLSSWKMCSGIARRFLISPAQLAVCADSSLCAQPPAGFSFLATP
jgi:hypothetical protein